MQKNRNIDITKVRKKGSINVTQKPKESISGVYKVVEPNKEKPKIKIKKIPKKSKPTYTAALKESFLSILNIDIFGLSLLRNIFSLRVIFFVLLPFAYIQLKYLLVLKPDQLLANFRSVVSPDNTFDFLIWGLFILVICIISWLADSALLPTMYRYKYQKLDGRKVNIGRSFLDIINNFLTVISAKFVRFIQAILGVLILILILYAVYLLGYGSLKLQLTWLTVLSLVLFVVLMVFCNFKYWLNIVTAVELYDSEKKYKRIIKNTLLRPFSSFGHGVSWLFGLALTITLSLAAAILEINILITAPIDLSTVLYLAGLTTLIYLVWSIWTASGVGYWTSIVHARREEARVRFGSAQDGSIFGFIIVLVILILLIGGYLLIAFLFSTQISEALLSIWSKLPQSLKFNLSKPQ
jgi:hypothetical protein